MSPNFCESSINTLTCIVNYQGANIWKCAVFAGQDVEKNEGGGRDERVGRRLQVGAAEEEVMSTSWNHQTDYSIRWTQGVALAEHWTVWQVLA